MATNTESYQLRRVRPGDRDFLFDLHDTTVKQYIMQIDGWDEVAERRGFAAWFRRARVRIVVVDAEDAGVLEVERGPDRVYLARIEIRPDFQRMGLGTIIVKDLLAEAAKRRVPLDLHVFKVNPARHLYQRLGFEIVGEDETRYAMRAHPPTGGRTI